VCVSPLNIAHALGMVMLSAESETREEVAKAVGFDKASEAHGVLSEAILALRSKDVASVAARLFVQRGFEIKNEFQVQAEKRYGAMAEKVDFTNPAASAEAINKWVAESTKNMITELISTGDIDPNMMIALCSALHFKGQWETPFEAPFVGDFHVDDENTVNTNFILKKSKYAFTYDADLCMQVVELPYTNGTQMILCVPQYHGGLPDIEKTLTDSKLRELCASLDRSGDDEVEVMMPKFEMETSVDLKDLLERMGAKRMFDTTGFLTELMHQPMSIGAAIHKVKIVVDEKGTEAAAATGMIALMRMAPMPVLVHANHPFLFFIRYNDHTLFGGRFTKPSV